MTNEEKSSQIANDMTLPWVTLRTPYDSIKQACEDMARWKDEQMKSNQYTWHKISDGEPKNKGWYIVYLQNGEVTSYYYETYDDEGFYPRNYCQYVKVVAWTEFPKYVD